jgi:hypothetical protein
VIFSAIFADIIVSIIAIIHTTKEIVINHLESSINCAKDVIEICVKGASNKLNFNSGYLSTKSNISGKKSLLTKNHKIIHKIVNVITAGNLGKYFLEIIKNINQNKKTINE